MRSSVNNSGKFRSSSYNPQMSPLRGSTLGVVGAGVMAEACVRGRRLGRLLAEMSTSGNQRSPIFVVTPEPTAGRRWAKSMGST